MSKHRGLNTEKQRTKWMLKICYSFYREWHNAREFMDMDEPNTFRYHLASTRAYQVREHLNKHFPEWMRNACHTMYMGKITTYKFTNDMAMTEWQQKRKEARLNPQLDDIPF